MLQNIFLLVSILLIYFLIIYFITIKFFTRCRIEVPKEEDNSTEIPQVNYHDQYKDLSQSFYQDPFPSAIPREFLKETNDRYLKIYAPPNPLRGSAVGVNVDDAFYGRKTPYGLVTTPFIECGIVTSHRGFLSEGTSDMDDIKQHTYKLLKRPIDPLRDWYEYQVYDFKNDLTIPLGMKYTYLEDGDVIDRISGKESNGSFKVKIFDKYNYIYT